jgi:cell division protein FtsL
MRVITVLAMLSAAVVASGVGLIFTEHYSRELFLNLENLQRERDDLEIEWGMLQLEQSTLATEVVIDHAARTRLRMAAPDVETVVYIAR